jgi:hypothetical protein
MTFLFQVLGVAAAGIAVIALWDRRGAVDPLRAASLVAVVLAGTLVWPNVWRAGDELNRIRLDAAEVSRSEAELYAGRTRGFDVDFLSWAGNRIPPGASFAIAPPPSDSVLQWATYQLFPRRLAPEEDADYLLFLDAERGRASYDRTEFGRPATYGSGLLVRRRRDAG